MDRKRELAATVRIVRTPNGIVINSGNGFNWKVGNLPPEVAITAVLGSTLAHNIDYESYFGSVFTVTLTIEHKHDE